MKRLKKAGALVLALLMTFVFAIPAMAAETAAQTPYSITIQNENDGHTYQAYQIFKGDYSQKEVEETEGEKTKVEVLANIEWGNGVDSTALLADLAATPAPIAGLEFTADMTAAEVAEELEGAKTEQLNAFADVVAKNLATVAGTATAPTDGVYTISGLAAGYYLVKDQDNSLQGDKDEAYTDYIVQVLGNTTMAPKSEVPSVEKKVLEQSYNYDDGYGNYYNDVADWDIGDSIPFKLIGTVPDMSAYDTYTYVFHDTLSAGLTLRNDDLDMDPNGKPISVYVANKKDATGNDLFAVRASDYTISGATQNDDGTSSWTITFTDLKTAMTAPNERQGDSQLVSNYKYILVNYDAYLDSDAVIGLDGNPNEVYLEYSNNPNGTGTGTTTTDKVIVFTYELDGTKVDGADNITKLKDAQFVLIAGNQVAAVNANGTLVGWVSLPDGKTPDTMTYADWTTFNGEQEEGNHIILTSDDEGFFKVSGLEDGTYFLREIQAPTGYNLLEDDVQVVITATTANGQNWDGVAGNALTGLTVAVDNGALQNGDIDTGIVNVTVANNQGSTLPETGGMGTTVFYVVGGVIVAGVLVLLVAKRRMGRAE